MIALNQKKWLLFIIAAVGDSSHSFQLIISRVHLILILRIVTNLRAISFTRLSLFFTRLNCFIIIRWRFLFASVNWMSWSLLFNEANLAIRKTYSWPPSDSVYPFAISKQSRCDLKNNSSAKIFGFPGANFTNCRTTNVPRRRNSS